MAQPQERISEDLKAAMKARDAERTSTLRMLLAELKNERIRAGHEVGEEEFLRVVQKAVKQRQDAAAQFRDAGRAELADKEEREAALLGGYLPAQLSEDEVRVQIEAFVREQGLAGPKDLGKVMQGLLPRFQGRVDGKVVQRLAREALGS